MTRLAVFGDIHGNLPAFEALLKDIRHQSPDALLCLGDVTADGAWPGECIQLLASLGCPVVMGNADEDLLRPRPFTPRGFPNEQELYELDEWGRTRLSAADLEVVQTYRATVSLPGLLAFHGSPADCREVIGADTPAEQLEQLRATYGQQTVWVGGHTHTPLLRTLDGWRLLNPGSVGLAYEKRGDQYVNVSRADYLLLDGEGVQFRRVPYDVQAVQAGILSSGMPHAAWWAGEWVSG
ncbi:metallophosphoesterase family protein [Deinococcus sp. KNUC1210]|uniref:metallophosphoesterase family protein n=1 Tax=Deinococcus sp. KNUC1210 TaxID=2917691 RepID=UPI001EF0C7E8|nr:metallophosphoesterase [Deinococcus sp. KNUC1210]ULH15710.1 metallophosphoesterase family protein [Deinococcus sp. KNUC1210]